MALSKDIQQAAVSAAREAGIEPAALLAVVEIESGGRPLEEDGVTPCLLFERHKFYSELESAGKDHELQHAVAGGLAHKDWRRSTQYADQGSSHGRLTLLASAAKIDRECAYRACSWGLGQTMGFHAEELGYPSAVAMVEAMKQGGIGAQITCMVGEIRRNHLDVALAKRDWTAFARGYNGKGYAANRYDERLRLAYAKWAVAYPPADDVEQIGDHGQIIAAYQTRLRELGYTPGTVDGAFGSRTRAAVLAFQAENGLPPDGRIDKLTRAALNAADAKAMPLGPRVLATADDLAKAGSTTIPAARGTAIAGTTIAALSAASGAQQSFDVVGGLQSWSAELGSFRGAVDGVLDVLKWAMQHWWLAAVVLGFMTWRYGRQIEWARLAAHRLGLNLGL